ncbi:unnamed protein product [Rhizophagus irregularis]|nr:unnamed protein product [Rhizophagus irregularis]CAB4425767.1 unnamed protein product [Rhizophagus irregularis]
MSTQFVSLAQRALQLQIGENVVDMSGIICINSGTYVFTLQVSEKLVLCRRTLDILLLLQQRINNLCQDWR